MTGDGVPVGRVSDVGVIAIVWVGPPLFARGGSVSGDVSIIEVVEVRPQVVSSIRL